MPTTLTAAPQDDGLGQLRDLIYEVCGIFFPDNKRYFLETRFARRMEATGAKSYRDYYAVLKYGANRDAELKTLIADVTTNETSFFRNMPQLEAVRTIVLPKLAERKSAIGFRRLKMWSAGCSTGEEPYTLAMMLAEMRTGLLTAWGFEVFATDINDRVLEKGKEGAYGEYALRSTPDAYKRKYFARRPDGLYALSPEIKKLVRFQNLNLYDDARMTFLKGFDVVFCCNVLIYFDLASKKKVIQHFFSNLNRGGYLFIGHSESLFGVNADFELRHYPGGVMYQKP